VMTFSEVEMDDGVEVVGLPVDNGQWPMDNGHQPVYSQWPMIMTFQ